VRRTAGQWVHLAGNISVQIVNEFILVLLIASIAALLTYLGAPAAERFDVPHRLVSAALQFAAGIITGLVAFSLMPSAVRDGPYLGIVIGFFLGGVLFVTLEYLTARTLLSNNLASDGGPLSLGLYIGILVDLVIDGVVIGIGSTLTLKTGLLLALGLSISTMPLAFVTIATAKKQGMSKRSRSMLAYLFIVCIVGGAVVGYGLLRNQSLETRLVLIALASGFLITLVTQNMIPEANREGEPSFAGIFFVGGISLYALLTLTLK
jgi:zinc transporter, ZIP family